MNFRKNDFRGSSKRNVSWELRIHKYVCVYVCVCILLWQWIPPDKRTLVQGVYCSSQRVVQIRLGQEMKSTLQSLSMSRFLLWKNMRLTGNLWMKFILSWKHLLQITRELGYLFSSCCYDYDWGSFSELLVWSLWLQGEKYLTYQLQKVSWANTRTESIRRIMNNTLNKNYSLANYHSYKMGLIYLLSVHLSVFLCLSVCHLFITYLLII